MTKVALAGSKVVTPDDLLSLIELDKNKILSVSIVLAHNHNGTSLEEYARGVINGSIKQQLTQQEFTEMFAPTAEEIDAVVKFAKSHNLSVLKIYTNSATVKLSGRVEDFNIAFGITLLNVVTFTSMYHSYEGEIYIPGELKDIIEHVIGLDDSAELTHSLVSVEPSVDTSAVTALRSTSLTPVQVANAYQFPPSTGASQTIGIIALGGGYTQKNLTSTFGRFNLPVPVVKDFLVGTTNKPDTGSGSEEIMLDVYLAGGVAPEARLVVYFGPTTSQGFYNAVAAAVHDKINTPSILSISWGSQASTPYMDNLFLAAIAMGITVTVATGDYGARALANSPAYTVQYPASSPYVLACGGTTLQLDDVGGIGAEYTWNSGNNGSGGGISSTYPLPTWQAGLRASYYPTNAVSPLTKRGIPDVAGNADALSGYQFYYGSTNRLVQAAGTSAVAPLYAGLIARINAITKRRCGYLNQLVYNNTEAFNDITAGQFAYTGNNACPPDGITRGYNVTAGWDACTGVGSPIGTAILNILNGIRYYPNVLTGTRPTSGQTYPRVLINN